MKQVKLPLWREITCLRAGVQEYRPLRAYIWRLDPIDGVCVREREIEIF